MDETRADGDDDDHRMRRVILRMTMGRMRMGHPLTPNGDRLAVFTSQQEQ